MFAKEVKIHFDLEKKCKSVDTIESWNKSPMCNYIGSAQVRLVMGRKLSLPVYSGDLSFVPQLHRT